MVQIAVAYLFVLLTGFTGVDVNKGMNAVENETFLQGRMPLLQLDVLQHAELNNYTLNRAITTSDRRPVEANQTGYAVIKITGLPGRTVRVVLEPEESLRQNTGSTMAYTVDTFWYSGRETSPERAFRLANRTESSGEFTFQLGSERGTAVRNPVRIPSDRERTRNASRMEADGRYDFKLKEGCTSGEPAPIRSGSTNRVTAYSTAYIYIVPKLMPDGTQRPGHFLADLRVFAEYDDLEPAEVMDSMAW